MKKRLGGGTTDSTTEMLLSHLDHRYLNITTFVEKTKQLDLINQKGKYYLLN